MKKKIIASLFAVALALTACLPAGAQETTEVLFSDMFTGDSLSKSWTLDRRSFEYEKYPKPGGVLETFVMDQTASLDFMADEEGWGGGAQIIWAGFELGPRQRLSFSIVRDFMATLGTGARSTLWVRQKPEGEEAPERWVALSDNLEDGIHNGWGYHRLIGKPGDNPEGAAILLPELQSEELLNYGSHRVQCVANGVTLAFFVEGIYGGEVEFPVDGPLQFGFGVYAQKPGDMVYAGFKNVQVLRIDTESGVPLILRQPASLSAMEGGSALFSVSAEDAESYQWYRDEEPIEGALEPELRLSGLSAEDAGSYWVTVSNEFGEVESQRANLTVLPYVPGEAELSYELVDGELILSFSGSLQESGDCKEWSGKLPVSSPYKVPLSSGSKFYRATF